MKTTTIKVNHPDNTFIQMVEYSGPNFCMTGTTDFSIIEPEQSASGEGETIDAIAKIRTAVGDVRFIAPSRVEVALLLQRHDDLQSEIATLRAQLDLMMRDDLKFKAAVELEKENAMLRKHNEELIFSVAAVLNCWYEDAGDVVRMTPKMNHLKLVRHRIEDAAPSLPDSGGDKNDDKAQLNKLLYAVASKFPNETRFETALRYIRQAERGDNCNVAATAIPLPKGDKK